MAMPRQYVSRVTSLRDFRPQVATSLSKHKGPDANHVDSLSVHPLFHRCYSQGRRQTVGVAISGGVDSAVAALLLKRQGHHVFGIFMRNWDEAEEVGGSNCPVRSDFEDAQRVCSTLKIPLQTADFVSSYWNDVFLAFLEKCKRGLTPNPDLPCNRHIKFDALLDCARSLGAEKIATGHYARLKPAGDGSTLLLKGVDPDKDQSYFLASVRPGAFDDVIFPLGGLTKAQVRQVARVSGLHNALRRSSAGICFIGEPPEMSAKGRGKDVNCTREFASRDWSAQESGVGDGRRRFRDFLAEYSDPMPGKYINVDSKEEIGLCSNMAAVTYGQRASLGGNPDRMFVVGKDIPGRRVFVALGQSHPALYSHTALLRTPHWLSGRNPEGLEGGALDCCYKARYRQKSGECTVMRSLGPGDLAKSEFTALMPMDMPTGNVSGLQVFMPVAARAITPEQEFVLYDGEVCLGSAPVLYPGRTLAEADNAQISCGPVTTVLADASESKHVLEVR